MSTISALIEELIDKTDDSNISQDTALRWFQNAYAFVYAKISNINENYFVTSATVTTTANVATVSLASDFMKLIRIEDSDKGKVLPTMIDSDNDGYFFQGTLLGFRPIPTEAKTYTYYYIARPTALTIASVPAIPLEYHGMLVYWALSEYYEKQQEEGQASYYLNKFNAMNEDMLSEIQRDDDPKYVQITDDSEDFSNSLTTA
jgi:hypothetical protein